MNEPRGNPFQGLIDMSSEMNRMRQLGRYGYEAGQEERTHATAWVPIADILARGTDLVIRIELAGVDREDIEVTFHENTLTISGERKRSPLDDAASFYVHERYYGVFRRSMTLPAGLDEDDIRAEFYKGLVEITVRGGAVTAEPRRIQVGERHG